MKKLSFTAKTQDGNTIDFDFKHLEDIYLDGITIKFNYKQWMKDGKFKENSTFDLTPESLNDLVNFIKSNEKLSKKFNVVSSEQFLKSFPTSAKLQEHLKNLEKLQKIHGSDESQ